MVRWVQIAEAHECPPGGAIECAVEERIVALFHVDDRWYALDGICPHQGGPLGKGCLTGTVVTCPWHGWQFDVRSGQHQLSRSVVQPRLAVRVEGTRVLVDLDGSPPAAD